MNERRTSLLVTTSFSILTGLKEEITKKTKKNVTLTKESKIQEGLLQICTLHVVLLDLPNDFTSKITGRGSSRLNHSSESGKIFFTTVFSMV